MKKKLAELKVLAVMLIVEAIIISAK